MTEQLCYEDVETGTAITPLTVTVDRDPDVLLQRRNV